MHAVIDDDDREGSPADWSAGTIAEAIRRRTVSVEEVLAAHLERAAAHEELNAFVTRRDEEELVAEARRAQRALDEGAPVGPLHGVPFSVKDVIATAGLRTTLGSRAFDQLVPGHDATAVARLRRAGGLLLGKTNCPELAFGTTCESPVAGPTLSPFGGQWSPGGSSGGEAVAVAVGASAIGLGGDFGGSLRWPAQCTGIAALRPTPGRVPGSGQLPGLGGALGTKGPAAVNPASLQGRTSVIGPLARSVADLALVLEVLAGSDPLDPFSVPAPGRAPVDPSRLRVGWSDGRAVGPVRAEVAAAVGALAAALEPAVACVEELPDALVGAHEAFNAVRSLEQLADHRLALGDRAAACTPAVRAILEGVPAPSPLGEATTLRHAAEVRASGLALLAEVDLLLLPVAGGPACRVDGTVEVDGEVVAGFALMAHCRAVSLLGAPAASVPIGRSREGLPLSVQVVGRPFAEAEVLAVAALVESVARGVARGPGTSTAPSTSR